jgi:hypothetical protein
MDLVGLREYIEGEFMKKADGTRTIKIRRMLRKESRIRGRSTAESIDRK